MKDGVTLGCRVWSPSGAEALDMDESISLFSGKHGLFGCVLNRWQKCWILDTEFEYRLISESLELGIIVSAEH